MRFILILCYCFIHQLVLAQSIEQFQLSFEGYQVQITSVADNAKGKFLLSGFIGILAEESNKDSLIAEKLGEITPGEQSGIVIQTDSSFHVQDVFILKNTFPSNLIYDAVKKKFWLGTSRLNYSSTNHELFGSWQIVLWEFDLEKGHSKNYPVETDFSCKLNEIQLMSDRIVCIASKEKLKDQEKLEIPIVLDVSKTKFHENKDLPYFKSPEILRVCESLLSANTSTITNHTFLNNAVYFAVTKYPYGRVPTLGIDFYSYGKGKLVSQSFIPEEKTNSLYYATNIQSTIDGNLLIAYVPKYDEEYFIIEKLDRDLTPIWFSQIPDLQSPDFSNEVIVLKNGKIVVAGLNERKTWSYFVVDETGKIEEEIDTKMEEKMRISFTKAFGNDSFICSFYSATFQNKNNILVISTGK